MAEPHRTYPVGEYVHKKLAPLQAQYARGGSKPTSYAQATIAMLRRNRLDDLGANPSTWEFLFDEMPAELGGRGDQPSHAESAIHQAMTLYASHQQGRAEPMHQVGRSFGRAVREVAAKRGQVGRPLDPGALGRFQRVCTATSPRMRLQHLQALIGMMRGVLAPLDYAQLGQDLYTLSFPGRQSGVLLRWGRDFHFQPPQPTTTDDDTTDPQETA
ncbi:type I-E CRISPR-associated protein Cse2/CasB [Enemella evansiae]|nr:type I-E CRISPR-associated protein Cse2/CasB [Enemella evansiae]